VVKSERTGSSDLNFRTLGTVQCYPNIAKTGTCKGRLVAPFCQALMAKLDVSGGKGESPPGLDKAVPATVNPARDTGDE